MLNVIVAIKYIFQFYTFMLLIRILVSWLPQLQEYRIVQFISYYTDPYLNLFRRIIPPLGMLDISPIIAFLCLGFIENILIQLLLGFVK